MGEAAAASVRRTFAHPAQRVRRHFAHRAADQVHGRGTAGRSRAGTTRRGSAPPARAVSPRAPAAAGGLPQRRVSAIPDIPAVPARSRTGRPSPRSGSRRPKGGRARKQPHKVRPWIRFRPRPVRSFHTTAAHRHSLPGCGDGSAVLRRTAPLIAALTLIPLLMRFNACSSRTCTSITSDADPAAHAVQCGGDGAGSRRRKRRDSGHADNPARCAGPEYIVPDDGSWSAQMMGAGAVRPDRAPTLTAAP